MQIKLYFIAIIPNQLIRDKILSLKLDLNKRFGLKHALKSPAHITLQMPFKKQTNEEASLIKHLNEFVIGNKSFNVDLNGYSHFSKHVLYIQIKNHVNIVNLKNKLNTILIDKLKFSTKQIKKKFHPHLTLATRDLETDIFHKIWPQFKNKEFKSNFLVNSIFLLKHNGKYWDIFKEFSFSKT